MTIENRIHTDAAFASIVAGIEPLETLEAAWDWGAFFGGVGIGVGLGGAALGGIGIGIAIT
ncbi:hypothetical protein MN032_08215 [Agromyces atrinae]|uniref:Uncharacterized protein n=1 Tax=Agromyces atrinae TaxID=592376 RepID=A0A4Q2M0M9_9MICO|nr:hypothetical protein [Agromyces atrinae]MCI2957674.1 hypothetical protein [Agromyces atrinae]NYD67017.1 hypothetical protein [Agromyces atrinae]RXZ85249.1 hypothetical protein ESP50_16210 [Agromyces atrinae]RXZ85357.1 hypothetical protein ESP50_15615 [Agromyces atrinae]